MVIPNALRLCVVLMAIFAVACSDSKDTKQEPLGMTSPKVADKSKASAIGKPSLGVLLEKPQQQIPVGLAAPIDLTLSSSLRPGQISVVVRLGDGLRLSEGALRYQIQTGDAKLPLSVSVIADEPGKYYVDVAVTDETGTEAISHKALSAIVWAGAKPERKAAAEKMDSGEGRVVLPAVESRH